MARILVIDDDAQLRSLLAHLLGQAGHQVASAEDGEKGIALYRAQPADLVITDIVMPKKGGLETIAELHREYPGVPTIVMSGGPDLGELVSAAPGFRSVRTIQKPFLPNELLAVVEEALAERNQ